MYTRGPHAMVKVTLSKFCLQKKPIKKQLSVDQCCKFAESCHPHMKFTYISIEMNNGKC